MHQHRQPAWPNRFLDAKVLKKKLTACSLNVAEYGHQFKVIDDAQNAFVVWRMMPNDVVEGRSCMEKLEVISHEMIADVGPRWTGRNLKSSKSDQE